MSRRHRSRGRTGPEPSAAPRTAPTADADPAAVSAAADGRKTPASAPPAGPKTARPRKPGPGAPAAPAPFPGPIRVVYPPVGARVTAGAGGAEGEPAGAFDALYQEAVEPLRRQVYVLTGDRELAGEAVGRAFGAAWQQWPEVARDSDPVGWLRAAAHTYALAPWQRPWRRLRRGKAAPAPDGAWWRALVRLHPERRRALLLHDGLGMSLARTAAEVEASTTAAAARIIAARRELASAAPETYDGGDAGEHLTGLLAAARTDEPRPPAADGVREASERGTRRRTYACFAAAGTVLLVTTVSMLVGPQPARPAHRSPAHQQPYAQTPNAGTPDTRTPNGPPPEGKRAAP